MLIISPIRLSPAIGVMSGAHYRMSTGHSSPALTHSRSSWGPRKVHVFATSTLQNESLVILTNKKFVL